MYLISPGAKVYLSLEIENLSSWVFWVISLGFPGKYEINKKLIFLFSLALSGRGRHTIWFKFNNSIRLMGFSSHKPRFSWKWKLIFGKFSCIIYNNNHFLLGKFKQNSNTTRWITLKAFNHNMKTNVAQPKEFLISRNVYYLHLVNKLNQI